MPPWKRIRASIFSHVHLPTHQGLIPKHKNAIQPTSGAPAGEPGAGTLGLSRADLSSSPSPAADCLDSPGFACTQSIRGVRRINLHQASPGHVGSERSPCLRPASQAEAH
jgi:hypothetical protein